MPSFIIIGFVWRILRKEGRKGPPPPLHPWATPKKTILNTVKNLKKYAFKKKICFCLKEKAMFRLFQKSSLVSGNQSGEMFFITYLPALVEFVWGYIYFFSKKHTQKQKIIPLANLFAQICVFSLQTIKDRALCFSTNKSALRVAF